MRAETREAIRLAIVARYGESGCERATDEIHTLVDADAAAQAAHHRKLVDDTAHVYEEVVRLRAEAAQTRALREPLVVKVASSQGGRGAIVCSTPSEVIEALERSVQGDFGPVIVTVERAALTGVPREPHD